MRLTALTALLFCAALGADVRTDTRPPEPARTEQRDAKVDTRPSEPSKTEPAKTDAKPEAKTDAKPEAKTEPSKPEPQKSEQEIRVNVARDATACLEITARVHTSAHPYSAPQVETRRVRGLRIGRAVLTDIDSVRGATATQMVSGSLRENLRLVYAGFDTGLALLFPEKDAPAAISIENTAPLLIDSDLSLYSCAGAEPEARRLRIVRIASGKLENNDNGTFETASVEQAVPAALSGSPVFSEGRFAGLLHRGKSTYILPASAVVRFLEDVQDGRYDGIPVPGFLYQPLTQADLRKYLNLPDTAAGVRITRAEPGSLLLAGDYLTSLAGQAVSSDGRIGSLAIEEFVQRRQAGSVEAVIVRGGRTLTIQLPLRPAPDARLRARSVDGQRRFFLAAGLVFQELDYDLLLDTKAGARPELKHRFASRLLDQLALESDQDLILTEVLADPANAGSDRYLYLPVESVNGSLVRNLRDLRSLFQSLSTRYIVIRFRNRAGAIVIERERIVETNKRIAERYALPESVFEEVLP